MSGFREKLIRFARDRYGYDDLNYTMLAAALLLDIIGMITKSDLCLAAALVFLTLVMIRALSKNRVKRAEENRRFRNATLVPRRWLKAQKLQRGDTAHRYYLCPHCHQICRVPKGRGSITVHCPSCGNAFELRS